MQTKNEGVKAYFEKVEGICFKLIEAMVLENPEKWKKQ